MKQDQLKQAVAQAALAYVLPRMQEHSVLGVGTGSTANFFIDALAPHKDRFAGAVASSQASAAKLRAHGITLFDLNDVEDLPVYVDGADETTAELMLIKGGGAALTQEKIIAYAADTFVCMVDESKWVEQLGRFPLPVEVVPQARNRAAKALAALGGKPVYREGVVTDNGGHILDVHGLHISNPRALEQSINQIPGVISNGLFAVRPADVLLLGTAKGVQTLHRPGLSRLC